VTGGATVQSLAYSFDAAGDLKTANDNVDATRNQAFNYDALYRLTQASGVYGTYGYGYDADNNRTTLSLSSPGNSFSQTYAYAATSNQLQGVTQGTTVRTISYTADGNTAADNLGTGAVFTYGYNNDNRMVQASLGGATQASYTLNCLGQRVIKSAVTSGTTDFHYDRAGHLIAESDGTGNVLREYVFLGDTPVAFVTPTGGIDIIHTDHLGTPQKMTDATQAVVWDGGASDPFMMSALPPTPAIGLRLPGQYFDGETGLHYNYFRDYDPSLGRYVQSDPVGLGGGINTYAYVGHRPTLLTDPLGLFPNLGPLPGVFPNPGSASAPAPNLDDCDFGPDSSSGPQNPTAADPAATQGPSDPSDIQPTPVADTNPPPAANDNRSVCDQAFEACKRWATINAHDQDSYISNRTDCADALQFCRYKLSSGHLSKEDDEVYFGQSGKVIFRQGYPPVFVPNPYLVPPSK
jgi:RHS repeat-associated protein